MGGETHAAPMKFQARKRGCSGPESRAGLFLVSGLTGFSVNEDGLASDELVHARFSESLDATLRTMLTVAQRRRLSEAREQALLSLSSSPVPDSMRRTLGLPDVDAARALVDTLLH